MPGFLEQLGALVSASDRNLRKFKEEEWLRANPGKPLPTGTGMVAQKEGMLQRSIRRGSEILADTFTTPGTAANQQFEGGFQAILNMVSPVDSSTGMPNVDKAGLVLSAANMPKIRASMRAFLSENPELVAKNPAAAQAMAYARAKYPTLSSIADFRFVDDPAAGSMRGSYEAVSNKADIYLSQHPQENIGFVDTIMHESTHSRQAMRERPDYINEKDKYLKRAVDFNERVDAGNFEGYRRYAKALKDNADKPMSERRELAMQAKSNYYQHGNPLEVPAHKAGQTARETYKTFENYNSLEGAQMPGSERSIVSTIADKARMTFDDILGLLKGGAEK